MPQGVPRRAERGQVLKESRIARPSTTEETASGAKRTASRTLAPGTLLSPLSPQQMAIPTTRAPEAETTATKSPIPIAPKYGAPIWGL